MDGCLPDMITCKGVAPRMCTQRVFRVALPSTCDSHEAMFNRMRITTTRAVYIASLQSFNAPRPFHIGIRQPCSATIARAHHTATAKFTNLGPEGTPVTKEVSIQVGEPGDAYVLIPTEVGDALQAGNNLVNSSSAPPKRPDRLTLSYFHDTQHFALGNSSPFDI